MSPLYRDTIEHGSVIRVIKSNSNDSRVTQNKYVVSMTKHEQWKTYERQNASGAHRTTRQQQVNSLGGGRNTR
jgi:hypothetical protein